MNKMDVFDADEYIEKIGLKLFQISCEQLDELRAQLFAAYLAGKEKAEEDCDC